MANSLLDSINEATQSSGAASTSGSQSSPVQTVDSESTKTKSDSGK